MKSGITVLTGIMMVLLSGCAMPLKMPPPPVLTLSGIHQHPYTVGLFVPREVKEYVYVKPTSPVDKMSYPIGNQTEEIFKKICLWFLKMLFQFIQPTRIRPLIFS